MKPPQTARYTGGDHLQPPDGSKPLQRSPSQRGDAELVGYGVDMPEQVIMVDDLPEEERAQWRRFAPNAERIVFPAVRWEKRVRR